MRLSVPSRAGEVLSVTIDGRLFYEKPGVGADDSWILVLPNTGFYTEGFYLVSANHRLAIDYNPERGEGLCASPVTFHGSHTIWYLSPESELYTIDDEGEKRYLWSILDSIYVTPDEHLAERWTAVSLEGYETELVPPKNKTNHTSLVIISGMLLLSILLAFLLRNKYQ